MIGIIFTNLASTGAPHDILWWTHAAKYPYIRLSYFAFNRFSPQWVLGSCHGRTAEMIEKWARPGQNISEIGLGNWVSPMAMKNPHLHQLLDIYEIMNIYQYCGYDSLFILLGGLEHEFNFHSWADSIQSDFHIFRGGGLYSTNQTVYIYM